MSYERQARSPTIAAVCLPICPRCMCLACLPFATSSSADRCPEPTLGICGVPACHLRVYPEVTSPTPRALRNIGIDTDYL